MGKLNKVLSLLLMIVMIVVFTVGCGGTNTTDSDKANEASTSTVDATSSSSGTGGITLTIYGDSANITRTYMQRIFEMYQAETGNKLDVQGIDQSNAESILLTKFQTGDIPDILMHFGGYSLDSYNPSKNFVDFSDAPWVADIASTSLAQTMRDGKVYGLPFWESSVSGCFYNKVIFEELGLKPATTQAEFDKLCEDLLKAGVQPIYMAVADTWPMLYQFGMDPIFKDKEVLEKLNSNLITYSDIPEMSGLMNWYLNCAQRGYFGKTYLTDSFDFANEVLGNGEAAMIFCWDTWFDVDYDSETFKYKCDDFGIMPMFMGTIDKGTYEGGNNSLLLVNKNGANVEVAKEFIAYCADPNNYNKAFEGVATTPTFKGMTTNKISSQYKGAEESINAVGNASIANPEIIGFSQADGGKAIQELLVGNVDVAGCLKLLDDARIKLAKSQQVEGF